MGDYCCHVCFKCCHVGDDLLCVGRLAVCMMTVVAWVTTVSMCVMSVAMWMIIFAVCAMTVAESVMIVAVHAMPDCCVCGVFPGPRLFLSCPMDIAGSQVWFTDLWNYSVVPYIIEAVRDGLQVRLCTDLTRPLCSSNT